MAEGLFLTDEFLHSIVLCVRYNIASRANLACLKSLCPTLEPRAQLGRTSDPVGGWRGPGWDSLVGIHIADVTPREEEVGATRASQIENDVDGC